MLQGFYEPTEDCPKFLLKGKKRIQRDPAYHILKDETYDNLFNYLNIIDRPFEDTAVDEADAP